MFDFFVDETSFDETSNDEMSKSLFYGPSYQKFSLTFISLERLGLIKILAK